jgi:hypothetical protein
VDKGKVIPSCWITISFGDSKVDDEDGKSVVAKTCQDILRLDIGVNVTMTVYRL